MIDKVFLPNSNSKTPKVTVWLTLVDFPSEYAEDQFRTLGDKSFTCQVHVGCVSAIDIGDVYKNQVLIGRINTISRKGKFPLSQGKFLQANSTEIHLAPPEWWTGPYRVINRSEFSLLGDIEPSDKRANFMGSYFTVVKNRQHTLVIPASVIFKAFYAPHSDFATALTSAPWGDNLKKIVAPDRTFVREDGLWELCLGDRIPDDFYCWAALLTLDKYALSCAKSIHSEMMTAEHNFLKAKVPFAPDYDLEIRYEAIELPYNPKKLLCTRITGIKWPFDMDSIHWDRVNNNSEGEEQVPVDKDKPYSKRRGAVLDQQKKQEGVTPNSSDSEPNTAYEDIRNTTSSIGWFCAPKKIPVKKAVSGIYRDTKIAPDLDEKQTTSYGQSHQGRSNAVEAIAEVSTTNTRSVYFEKLTLLLGRMTKKNLIKGYSVVNCPDDKHYRNGHSVWVVPRKKEDSYGRMKDNAWSFLDKSKGKKKGDLRTIFVCRFKSQLGNEYLWFEIESRKATGEARALIHKLEKGDDIKKIVKHVCWLAVDCSGTWKNAKSSIVDVECTWKHQFDIQSNFNIKSVCTRFNKLFNESMKIENKSKTEL